jgi:hypothetical protein
MKRITLLFTFVMLAFVGAFAQDVPENLDWVPIDEPTGIRADPSVFLQGNFVEIGISVAGSCGTVGGGVPAGYHAWSSNLGFVADFNLDGWANGVPPYSGDYFLPGDPYEGWLVEFTYGGSEYTFQNAQASGYNNVPQTSLINTSSGSTNSAVWTGTATGGGQSLLVVQNFHFADNDAKFMIDVTLTNTGTEPLQDVEYARAVDPDQEVNLGGYFETSNYVGHQPDGTNNLAQVVGNGLTYGTPMGLQMIHPNAKAHCNPAFPGYSYGELKIYTPNEPLDFTNAPTQGAPLVADAGVSVATRIAVLNPGQSVTIPVAYVLNEEEIINPPSEVPVSNWALALMVGLIVIFTIIRFKRMN